MSCHLNQLFDAAEAGRLLIHDGPAAVVAARHDRASNALNRALDAVCFDFGNADTLEGLPINPDMLRLPFDTCWFEFTCFDGDVLVGVIAMQSEDRLSLYFFQRLRGVSSPWCYVAMTECAPGETGDITCIPGSQVPYAQQTVMILTVFLGLLHCVNSERRKEHVPDKALQLARQRRGKKPLFSYWTLDIDLQRDPAIESRGAGTHSSPRLHLRRGHFRLLKKGWIWVRAHVVGNKKAGMVHKDYRAQDDDEVQP